MPVLLLVPLLVPREPFLPDPGTAHDLLRAELYKREYQPSLLERVQQWFQDLLDKLQGSTGNLSGISGLVVLLMTLLLLAVAVVVLARLRRTTGGEQVAEPVFGEVRRTASEHRLLARSAYDGGAWDEAVVEGMRALAAGLVERQLVEDLPAATAHEVTTLASPRFPAYADRLEAASRVFDETRYGDRRANRDHATAMLELDRAVSAAAPVTTPASRGPVAAVPR